MSKKANPTNSKTQMTSSRRGKDNTVFNLEIGKDYIELHAHLPKRRTIISLGLIVATVLPVIVELSGRLLQISVR